MTSSAILDAEFLSIRAKLLEIAATLDRLDRAEGAMESDPRLARIQEAIELLTGSTAERAEQIQLLFSRQYDDDWRDHFGMTNDE